MRETFLKRIARSFWDLFAWLPFHVAVEAGRALREGEIRGSLFVVFFYGPFMACLILYYMVTGKTYDG